MRQLPPEMKSLRKAFLLFFRLWCGGLLPLLMFKELQNTLSIMPHQFNLWLIPGDKSLPKKKAQGNPPDAGKKQQVFWLFVSGAMRWLLLHSLVIKAFAGILRIMHASSLHYCG